MLELIVSAFTTLFVVVDPVGTAALFAAMTQGGSYAYKRRMALRSTIFAALILVLFALVGGWLLTTLGIGLPAFRVAGGVLLFFMSIDMVFARPSGLRSTTVAENQEAEHKEDISVFPLAIPLLAGPGAITTVLLLTSDADGATLAIVLGVMLGVMAATLLAFLLATRILRVIGVTGANVIGRVLGVLLAALAVQFVLDGLKTSLF